MALLMGVDEAGYGPNLGPLVVSVTVWRTADASLRDSLYDALDDLICDNTADAAPTPPAKRRGKKPPRQQRLVIADSKAIYSSQHGLAALEENVLALLAACRPRPMRWSEAWSLVPDGDRQQIAEHTCWAKFDRVLPLSASAERVELLAARACEGFAAAPVRLIDVRSRTVFPARWNQLLGEHPNKAAVLSHTSLGLLCETIALYPDEEVYVVCDKHGGRDRYLGLLQHFVGDTFVEVHGESRVDSVYRWGSAERRVEVRFRPRAEAYLPTALASMVSKYLRELAMEAFNHFWTQAQPELRPTKGYPTDARRWLEESATVRQQLGIELAGLWRER
ncbi:MAG: hypothetical protein JSS27_03035 [Planctomycetes bacterium]|nr:hypothetical protein [Planctomycetota bacterium]